MHYQLGHYREALHKLEASLVMERRLRPDGDAAQTATTLHNMGRLYHYLGPPSVRETMQNLEASLVMQRR